MVPTQTQKPAQSYHCPDGTPEGWGQVTPDPYWMMQCGQCTVPDLPTRTPQPTNTVAPGEPTSTPAPTQDPHQWFYLPIQEEYSFEYQKANNSCKYYNWCWGVTELETFTFDCGEGNSIKGIVLERHGYIDVPHELNTYVTENNVIGEFVEGYSVDVMREGAVTSGDTAMVAAINQVLVNEGMHLDFWDVGNFGLASSYTGNLRLSARGSAEFDVSIAVIGAICYGIPQEPDLGASYCDAVNGDGGTGDNELDVDLPDVVVSQPYCLAIGGGQVDMSVLNLIPGIDDIGDIQIPGFNLCYRYISFGSLSLFGMGIDLDIMAMLLGGVALVRIFLRS